jgi:hypothetical protein
MERGGRHRACGRACAITRPEVDDAKRMRSRAGGRCRSRTLVAERVERTADAPKGELKVGTRRAADPNLHCRNTVVHLVVIVSTV